MYEDLVKHLRERAAWINFPHHGEEYPTEDAKLMMDAADAIEELSREVKSLYKILGAHPDPKGKPGEPGVSPKEETE